MNIRFVARVVLACVLGTRALSAQSALESAIARAHQHAAANDTAASRSILDSLLASRLESSMQRAEASYWLARYAPSAADRERGLSALIIDYPFSPRVPRALYEVGMLELSHSDRERAAVHLTRFLSSSPEDSNRVSASLTLGKILLDIGETPRGCAVLLVGRLEVPESAIETRTQFDFFASRCRGVDTSAVAARAAAPVDTVPAPRRTGAFTVQVAAYDLRGPADRLATTLRGQGLEARVVGKTKPFRVRVGRYATRAEAETASQHIDSVAKSKSFVVVAGPEDM